MTRLALTGPLSPTPSFECCLFCLRTARCSCRGQCETKWQPMAVNSQYVPQYLIARDHAPQRLGILVHILGCRQSRGGSIGHAREIWGAEARHSVPSLGGGVTAAEAAPTVGAARDVVQRGGVGVQPWVEEAQRWLLRLVSLVIEQSDDAGGGRAGAGRARHGLGHAEGCSTREIERRGCQ